MGHLCPGKHFALCGRDLALVVQETFSKTLGVLGSLEAIRDD